MGTIFILALKRGGIQKQISATHFVHSEFKRIAKVLSSWYRIVNERSSTMCCSSLQVPGPSVYTYVG